MKSIQQWLKLYDEIALIIPDEILDLCDEWFHPDDDYYYVQAARMYTILKQEEEFNGVL